MIKTLKFLREKVHPKSIVGGKKKQNYFNKVNRNLQKYENIYRAGGLVSQAIDAYPLFGLSSGFELEGPEDAKKMIEDWLYKIDINQLMWQAWVDSLVYGDGIQENVFSKKKEILYGVPRNPKYFEIIFDEWGMVVEYVQRVNNKVIKLEPKKVTNLSLITLSGENYGISLIQRAFDDIMRDTKTAESTAVAIERHGFPRFHVKAGTEENGYSDDEKLDIGKKFEELKADNEFITNPDVEILPIDTQGVGKVNTYNEWSLGRLLGALGVPSEVIGTGQNVSTYATASVEMVSFYKRVETQQQKVARCFNGMIDLKTGIPGSVQIVFNPIGKEGLVEVEPEE